MDQVLSKPQSAGPMVVATRCRDCCLKAGCSAFGQLTRSTPIEIRSGAEDEAEMGAFRSLYQPQRESNLRVRLEEYLRFGLEAGIIFAT